MTSFRTDWAEEIPSIPEISQIEPLKIGPSQSKGSCTEDTEDTEETEETDEPDEIDDVPPPSVPSLRKSALALALKQPNSSNKLLFEYARVVRGLEVLKRFKLSVKGCEQAFLLWQEPSRPFLRTEHDYFLEFLEKLELVRSPCGVLLIAAFERAQKAVPPKQVQALRRDAQLVACLCRELQRDAGDEPFYLAGRPCAQLLGHENHTNVASWLRAFCGRLKLLILIEPGRQRYAARYRYIGPW